MPEKLSVNPWVGMWVRPRETIRAIVQFNPRYLFTLMCMIYGFPMLLQMAQNLSLGERFPLAGIVVVALVLAALIGMIMINIAAGLFYWTGKWIGGTGSFQNIRAAVAWSNLPSIVNIAIWLMNMAVYGNRIFTRAFVETPFVGSERALMFVTAVIQLAIAVWAFIIILNALSEVQGFSAWKALANMIIPFVIIFVGIFILAWVGSLMSGAPR